jgi:hypothetical protein
MLSQGKEYFQLIFSVKKIRHSLTASEDGLKTLNKSENHNKQFHMQHIVNMWEK